MPLLPSFDRECFLISPIGSQGSLDRSRADEVRSHIIEPVVEELGLTLIRADDIAEPGDITQQVIEHCTEAKAVVADLTTSNANVFYELGLRHASGGFAVMISEDKRLPFDITTLRTIFFDRTSMPSVAACKSQIGDQLRAGLAKPPVPIVAQTTSQLEESKEPDDVLDVLRATAEATAGELINVVAERLSEFIEQERSTFYFQEDPFVLMSKIQTLTGLIGGEMGQLFRLRMGLDPDGVQDLDSCALKLGLSLQEVMTLEARFSALISSKGVADLLSEQTSWIPGHG